MSITTRAGTSKDLNDVLALNQANQPHLSGLTSDELQSIVQQAALFSVVELDQQFAGFVLGLLPDADYGSENLAWFKRHYQNFFYVDRIAIADHAQGQGCGSVLYREVENYCREKNIAQIALEVNTRPLNQNSLDFHRHQGYGKVGTQETGGGSKTVSLMMKRL